MCPVENAKYMPCFARFTCFWEEIDGSTTTTAQPTTTVLPPRRLSSGKIIGYTILVLTLLGLAAVAIWFGIRKLRSRTGNDQLAVVYQPTSNLHPHPLDRWRFSWPDYPEYIHIPILETKNLKYLLLLLEYPFFLFETTSFAIFVDFEITSFSF